MENLLPVLLIIGISMLAMNLGLIFKNKPLRKACGDSPDGCEICGGDQDKWIAMLNSLEIRLKKPL